MRDLQDVVTGWQRGSSESIPDVKAKNDDSEVKKPDWGFWRQRDFVRVWQAAMLSLNIDPNMRSRGKVKSDDTLRALYYSRKRIILSSNSKFFNVIQDHPAAGEGKGDWVIHLPGFCKYAKEQLWPEAKVMCDNILKKNRVIRINDGEINPKAKHSMLKQLEAIFMTFDGFDGDKGKDYSLVVKKLNEINCSYVADKRTIENWFEKY